MRKGIGTDDGLVWLYRKTGDGRDQTGTVHDLCRVEFGIAGKDIAARAHGHHHFFQCRVTGAFAQAIDRAFNLACTMQHGSQ